MLKTGEKKNKGFTLIELVIVVAILAILVGVLAPQYTKYVEKSRKAADASNMSELVKAVEMYVIEGNTLKAPGYIIKIGSGSGTDETGITETDITGVDDTEFKKAIDEACPNWRNLTVKSKKWGNTKRVASISAIIKVELNGGLSVKYSPDKFAEYMGNGN